MFDWDGAGWVQLGQDIDGALVNDVFGRVSMSSNGDRVAIGATSNMMLFANRRACQEYIIGMEYPGFS